MPMEMKAEYLKIFAEEAQEQLQEWEQALLSLERNPADQERVNQIFRCVHTLKGSAGFIGYEGLQKYAHKLESALVKAREAKTSVGQKLIDDLFRGIDAVRRMVGGFLGGSPPLPAEEAEAGAGEEDGADGTAAPSAAVDGAAQGDGRESPVADGFHRYQLEVLIKASNREAYLRSLLVNKRIESLGPIRSCDPRPEQLRDSQGEFRYRVLVDSQADLDTVSRAVNIDQVEVKAALREEPGSVPPAEPAAAAAPEPAPRAAAPAEAVMPVGVRPDEVVRVSVEKLDRLLNLVGELVVQNSGFISLTQQLKDDLGRGPLVLELEGKTEALTKVSRDLQDGIMKVRMLPVSNVFNRFSRVVRDLARDRKKKVVLDVYGEETEIDKKVMDRIGEPLVHLIRNAIDHGLEQEEVRRKAGKDPTGTVRLGAYQEGDHICIEVADDGKGLDREAILAKALERGLFRREDIPSVSEKRILEAVFLPGFSTAKEVTDISGRGVGMDVVKRTVEEMGGSISLRTAPGRGTTVTISLPLTMAIIPTVMVEVNGATLAIPLSSVREIVKLTGGNLHTIGGQSVLRLREEVLSLVGLSEALEMGGGAAGGNGGAAACREDTPAVIVEYEGRRIGLGVDRILNTGEVVIKSLSRHYREIEGLIGASILGNGRIALIVDVEAMVRAYHSEGAEDSAMRLEDGGVRIEMFGSDKGPVAAPAAGSPPPADSGSADKATSGSADGAAGFADEPARAADEPARAADEAAGPETSVRTGPRFEELLRRNRQVFEEIHNNGAIQASIALSQLTGKEIRVSFPESMGMRLADIAGQLGGEELLVGGIYIGLQGELEGAILQIIPHEHLLHFVEVLYGHPEGSVQVIGENELSGLTEMGNILSASFFNAIADATGLSVKPEVPEISMDMCQAVLDSVLARFNQPGEEILLTRAEIFYSNSDQMACHLLIFLDPGSLQVLVDAFARQSRLEPT